MKRPYKILTIILSAIALTVLVIAVNVSRSRSQVRGVVADIRYGRTPVLVDGQTVVDSVLARMPQLTALRVMDVDRQAVADAAASVAYLRDVTATVSVSGKVVVHARQRRPVARLFYAGREFYFDADGVIMPVSQLGECDVLVAGGDFAEPLRPDSLNSQAASLVALAAWLDGQRRYRGLVDQVYIERDGDIIMVPKLGNHIVELGPAVDLDDKFANLLAFYRKGMPRAGWDTYSKLSLKFKGQVVATKRKE